MFSGNIFGSKAILSNLLPCMAKILYFAPPDHSGFAFIVCLFKTNWLCGFVDSKSIFLCQEIISTENFPNL